MVSRAAKLGAMAVAAIVIGILVYVLRPRGERIAEVDLRAPNSIHTFDLSSGDKLYFRTSVTATGGTQKAMREALRRSRISVELAASNGSKNVSDCGFYDNASVSMTVVGNRVTITGAEIACTITVDATGNYTLRPSVAWEPGIAVSSASLEVRRERAK